MYIVSADDTDSEWLYVYINNNLYNTATSMYIADIQVTCQLEIISGLIFLSMLRETVYKVQVPFQPLSLLILKKHENYHIMPQTSIHL